MIIPLVGDQIPLRSTKRRPSTSRGTLIEAAAIFHEFVDPDYSIVFSLPRRRDTLLSPASSRTVLHIFRNHSVASRIPRWRRRWDQSVAKTGRTLAFSLVTNFTLFTQFYIFYSQHRIPSLFFPHFLLVTPSWDIFCLTWTRRIYSHARGTTVSSSRDVLSVFERRFFVLVEVSSKTRKFTRILDIYLRARKRVVAIFELEDTRARPSSHTHTHTRALFIVIRKETTMCLTYIRRPRRITSIIFPASFPEHSPIQRKRRRGKEKITKKIIKFYVSSKHT